MGAWREWRVFLCYVSQCEWQHEDDDDSVACFLWCTFSKEGDEDFRVFGRMRGGVVFGTIYWWF